MCALCPQPNAYDGDQGYLSGVTWWMKLTIVVLPRQAYDGDQG